MTWTPIGKSSELDGPGPFTANANEHDLVVVRGKTGLKVYEGRCPHQGA